MRGRIGFACLFALCLWAGLRAFGQLQPHPGALPPAPRLSAPAAALPQGEAAPLPPACPRQASRRAAPPRTARPLALPQPSLPYYRAAWQAFHLEDRAG